MNLTSKRARVPIAALGVAALACGSGALFNAALAVGTDLAFGPTPTSATIVDVNPNAAGFNGSLAYGFKVTGSSDTTSPTIISAAAGNPGALYVARYAGNGAPAAPSITTTTTTTAIGATVFTPASMTGIAAGNAVIIGTGSTRETLTVTSVTATTFTTTAGAAYAHVIGDPISVATTALTAASVAGATTFTVASSAGLSVGSKVLIGTGTSAETLTVATVPTGTTFTANAAANAHAVGEAVNVGAFNVVAAGGTRTLASYANADNVFVGAAVPGDYTFNVFKDVNGNGSYDAAQDDQTSTFTLHVKDVTGYTSTSADDLDFGLSAPSTSGIGQSIPVTAALTGVTTTDTRGGTTLGSDIAAGTTFSYSGATGASAGNGPATFNTTSGQLTGASGTVTAAGTVTTTARLAAAVATTSTNVVSNNVAHLTLAAPTASGTVATDGTTPTQVDVKTGTSTTTFQATATDSSGTPAPVAGATVYFTIGGTGTTAQKTAQVATVTTDGTTVDTSSATSHVYSAVTDSTGVATLKVTDSATTANTTYTVSANTNGVTSVPPTLTAVYQAAAASTVSITSTPADLTPVAAAGASVTIKGKLTDQFGSAFTTNTGSQQVDIFIGTTSASCPAVSFAGTPASTTATAHAAVTGGTFSYTYTPATTPTAGQCTSFGVGYDTNGDGNIQASEATVGTINWGTSTAAAKIVLTTPANGATAVTLQDNTTPVPAQNNAGTTPFGNTTGAVTGTVTDSTGAPLAFKPVTLSGDDGVLFSTSATPDATHPLSKTLSVVTTNSGAITGAYVYFTKAGTMKVNATSGTATATSTVTTDAAAGGQAYTVTADDAAGTPGSTLILTGKVTDIFGNPVPNTQVDLSTGSSTIGALGDNTPLTNSDGVWSTTFTTGSNQDGEATLTATLHNQTANATPNAAYATAGLTTLPTGDYQATAKVTVTAVNLGIGSTAPANTVSSGATGAKVTITGTFLPGASIQILSKASGASTFALAGTATADSTGKYSKSFTVKKSTVFISQSNGMSSSTKTITVKSTVTLTAKSSKAGKVTLSANGNPNGKFHLSFYRSKTGTDPRVAYVLGSSTGSATVTVSAPKGTDKYYVTFQALGTSKGTSKTVSVKVK